MVVAISPHGSHSSTKHTVHVYILIVNKIELYGLLVLCSGEQLLSRG